MLVALILCLGCHALRLWFDMNPELKTNSIDWISTTLTNPCQIKDYHFQELLPTDNENILIRWPHRPQGLAELSIKFTTPIKMY